MNTRLILSIGLVTALSSFALAQPKADNTKTDNAAKRKLYLDVHDFGPGKVNFQAVEGAHKKDLATQAEFDTKFIKYWVDEQAGKVYCLAESGSEANLFKTHQKAHGLVPDYIMQVTDGPEAKLTGKPLFLDTHHLEPGALTPEAVAGAHTKDLATQGKYGVNFVNYWVDVKQGMVMCLSEAPDSLAVIKTHTEAHGLVPSKVERVKQGN
jgi:hypothetical protein